MTATKLHDATQAALNKGWLIVKSTAVQGDGFQAPGQVTLCRIENSHHPFAVHFFNEQDGGFHGGQYCENYAEADREYSRQVTRFTRHHKAEV